MSRQDRPCRRILKVSALALAILLLGAQVGAAVEKVFLLVDDRRQPLDTPLEICLQIGTELKCSRYEPDLGRVSLLQEFSRLRFEGPRHGPTSVRLRQLKRNDKGEFVVTLARKGTLQLLHVLPGTTTVSLYRQDDAVFRQPYFRSQVETAPHGKRRGGAPPDGTGKNGERAEVVVPSGTFVVSLSRRPAAPVLALIELPPAGTSTVAYRETSGWSLVTRVITSEDSAPISDATIDISSLREFEAAEMKRRTTTNAQGLGIFSGMPTQLIAATVRHPGFVTDEFRGLSATPGQFFYHEAPLERGGRIVGSIHRDGEPVAGVVCRFTVQAMLPAGPEVPRPKSEVESDSDGVCRSHLLNPGWFMFEVEDDDQRVLAGRVVAVASEEETEEHFDLQRIGISGRVSRGTTPIEGAVVEILKADPVPGAAGARIARQRTTATTDGDGEYRTEVWEVGPYRVGLRIDGAPTVTKSEYVGLEDRTIDFELHEMGVFGTVVDDEGTPMASAGVHMSWSNGGSVLSYTDENGRFHFSVAEDGIAIVRAIMVGYQPSESVEVEVDSDAAVRGVVLRLVRDNLLHGVLTSGGQPISDASVASAAQPVPGVAVTNERGEFTVPSLEGTTRLFVGGIGCPLAHYDLTPIRDEGGQLRATLDCTAEPSSIFLHVRDVLGASAQNVSVILQRDGVPVPDWFVRYHAAHFGVPAASDGRGRLALINLAPGRYDLFLAPREFSRDGTVPATGEFLSSVQLDPRSTAELIVTLE